MTDRIEQILDYISGQDGIQILSAFEELLAMPSLRHLITAEDLAGADRVWIQDKVDSMNAKEFLDMYYMYSDCTPGDILDYRKFMEWDYPYLEQYCSEM